MTDGRHGHDLVRLADGTLYVVGGFSHAPSVEDRGQRDLLCLRPGSRRWEERASLPRKHAFAGAVPWRGAIYAISQNVLRYDPGQNSWTELTPAGSLPKSHFACALWRDAAYVLGGFPNLQGGMWRIDLASGNVTAVDPPPGFGSGHHFHVMHALGDELHVVGGLGDRGGPKQDQHSWNGSRWRARAAAPFPIWAKFAIHVARGTTLWCWTESGGARYDASSDRWYSEQSPLPLLASAYLAMPGCISDDDGIWVLGGQRQTRGAPVFLRFRFDTGSWQKP